MALTKLPYTVLKRKAIESFYGGKMESTILLVLGVVFFISLLAGTIHFFDERHLHPKPISEELKRPA